MSNAGDTMFKDVKHFINILYGTPKYNIIIGSRSNGKKHFLEALGYKLTPTNKRGWYKIEKKEGK